MTELQVLTRFVRNGFKELLLQFRTLHVRLLQDEKVGILTHSD